MKTYPKDVNIKMIDLANELNYKYKKIKYLRNAMDMNPVETEYKSENYCNSSMAVLGDRVLSFVITYDMFKKGMSKGRITIVKSNLEMNESLKKFKDTFEIKKYAFKKDYYAYQDEEPGREKVSIGSHEEFVEAIIAAIYLDRGLKYVTKWIKKVYLNKIKNSE